MTIRAQRSADRGPRVVPIRETTLFRAAIREIERQDAEIKRLRARLAEREAKTEVLLDRRHEHARGEL
jgi:hypothetical protein